MDNVCHSLAGAAIAHTGFARRLPRATLLAIIAANIPDVDAFTYLGADRAFAVSFRRGWTHGIPALIVWAVALAVAFALWQRRRPRSAAGAHAAASWQSYLPLAAISVVSHPALDWLNNYGVRFFMPFSDEWFYGDALFIVDPALIALFGLGWWASSQMLKAGSHRAELAARTALALALIYVATMKTMSVATLGAARRAAGVNDTSPQGAMVAPTPFSLTRRELFVRRPESGAAPSYDAYPATWTAHGAEIGARESHESSGDVPAVRAAVLATKDGERFLRWSRFPYFMPGTGADSGTIFVGDARYSSGASEGWAGIRVRVRGPR